MTEWENVGNAQSYWDDYLCGFHPFSVMDSPYKNHCSVGEVEVQGKTSMYVHVCQSAN